MSARVYFMKRVKDCKYVSIMSPHDEQCRRTSLLCILQFSCFTKYNRMQLKHKQTKCEHSRRNSYRLQLSQQVSLYQIKELFKKTISNSSLNSHVFGTPCICKDIFQRTYKTVETLLKSILFIFSIFHFLFHSFMSFSV